MFSFLFSVAAVQVFLTLLLLLFPSPATAQGLSGYLEGKAFGYVERADRRDPWVAGWGTLFNKFEDRIGDAQFTASLRAEGITSDEQGSLLFDPADRRNRRPPLSVQDFWLRLPLAPSLDLQMGRFQLGWGKTDGYSPADAFLPRDLSDPFADEKIPLWAIRLSGQTGSLRYEAVGTPVTTPWRLPELGGRNAPLAVPGVSQRVIFNEKENSPPLAGFAALRLLATFGEWDVGAWGRFGVRPAPLLTLRMDRAIPGPSSLIVPAERRYAREDAGGVELSRVVGSWVVRGEAAALFSRDRDVGNAVIGSLSAERGFGDGTLLVTLAANVLDDSDVDAARLYDRAMLPLLIAAWNRTEEWGDWKVVWSAGLKQGDGLVEGEIGYNLTDVWKVTVGVDLPYGPEDGPFGALGASRRGRLALRRSW